MSYTSGKVDYNKAKIAAYVVVAGFLAIMFVIGVRSATGPELHDGDRTESVTCPLCNGSGEGKETGKRCQACLGNKKLKAVIPGPNHPVDVRGTVRDLTAFKDQAEADLSAAEDAKQHKPSLTPVRGAIPEADILLEGGPETTRFRSKATGRFWGVIAPGDYKLKVTAPGFTTKDQQFTVKPRQVPIWPDAGGLEAFREPALQLDLFLEPAK